MFHRGGDDVIALLTACECRALEAKVDCFGCPGCPDNFIRSSSQQRCDRDASAFDYVGRGLAVCMCRCRVAERVGRFEEVHHLSHYRRVERRRGCVVQIYVVVPSYVFQPFGRSGAWPRSLRQGDSSWCGHGDRSRQCHGNKLKVPNDRKNPVVWGVTDRNRRRLLRLRIGQRGEMGCGKAFPLVSKDAVVA